MKRSRSVLLPRNTRNPVPHSGCKITRQTEEFSAHRNLIQRATVDLPTVFQPLRVKESRHAGDSMETGFTLEVRRLCKAVAEEQDSSRIQVLLDELLQIIDERQLIASLL